MTTQGLLLALREKEDEVIRLKKRLRVVESELRRQCRSLRDALSQWKDAGIDPALRLPLEHNLGMGLAFFPPTRTRAKSAKRQSPQKRTN
jgi:hypothetical protein